MKVELKDKERIDDLQRNGYQIIQNPEKFCFGMDAVLLTGFAHAREKDILLDLGTGTGIIPLLMEAKYHCSHLTVDDTDEITFQHTVDITLDMTVHPDPTGRRQRLRQITL